MAGVELILILLAAAAALDVVARRLAIPLPVLLVAGGAGLAFVPGLPKANVNPEIAFLVFVPPLLYAAAIRTSLRDLTRHIRAISLLSVGLVLVTIVAVAFVAHELLPELPWAAAFAFGAIVSPPDPIAVTAVTRRLPLPRNLVTLLEGEGLFNDATALVAYRMAVGAVAAGTFSLGAAALRFLWSAAGGVIIGLLAAAGIVRLRQFLERVPVVQNTISLLTPFAIFIPAERLQTSGVLAVVAGGLYLGRQAPRLLSPQTRIPAQNIWEMVSFILEGLVFILTGLELPFALKALEHHGLASLLRDVALIAGAAIVLRILWVFPAAYPPRLFRRGGTRRERLPAWREVFFIGWAGVRGADSLVIALSLPVVTTRGHPFPGRDLIVFLTFGVIAVTLVLQGLTLKPVIKALGLKPDRDETEEEIEARSRAAAAGLAALDRIGKREKGGEMLRSLRERLVHRAHRYEARSKGKTHERDENRAAEYRRLRRAMIEAERREIIGLRDRDVISDAAMRKIERDLDLEQTLLESQDASWGAYEAEDDVEARP